MTNRIPAGYTITRRVAEDGYVTYRVTVEGVRGWAETDYRREAVAVANHHARTGHWGGQS